MEVRIGVHESQKEIVVELDKDVDADSIIVDIEKVVSSDDGMMWLTDRKGRRVGIPGSKVAYVEISVDSERSLGFGR